MNNPKTGRMKSVVLNAVMAAGITALLAALGSFAYLGTFTRYLADDYCETVMANSGSLINALIVRYQNVSDRYSNLLFDALSEFLFPRQIQIMPVVMIVLWTAALIWLVREIKLFSGLQWPFAVDVFLGASLSFFSILEAPNRFQTIYWRSAMATHFAPLVYLTALSALALLQIRKTEERRLPIWMGLLFMVLAFVGGGFSEPPDAILIVSSALILAAIVIFYKGPRRQSAIFITAWTLAGGLLALLVMALAPGNALRLGTPTPGFVTLVSRTLLYVIQFIWDVFIVLPAPSLLSVALPFLLFYYLFQDQPVRQKPLVVMLVTPVLMYILIAASFAPSVYGQSFPEERARFAGQLILIASLMVEGACLGAALSQIKVRWQSAPGYLALGLLAVASAFYPLRAAGNAVRDSLPHYSKWASKWDARQSQIFAEKAQGKQDIVIPQLYGIEHIKELDTSGDYWINRCAAEFYGVRSISAPATGNP
ncbi:MAG: DUF6056 family protein [Chloroflexi bacterium]|nr:DUF6056 family protein [Chloroflexota bacterium]